MLAPDTAQPVLDLPGFDRAAIEGHVSLLHDMAEGIDGVLILAAFEAGGHALVQRFRIGDVDGMVGTIMGFENHPNLNLYAPWSVFRGDLEPGKKGSEADVVAVLAAVGDLDNDKYSLGELPVEAPYIIETSPGNFQPVYIFERPLAAAVAKPVLAALCDFVGGDSATKDTSHVWRIPGCLNWPTKSKLARGRPPVPVLATIKKGYDGGFTSPAALLALAPPPRPPKGHDTAPSGSLTCTDEARLRSALAAIPAEDRGTWLKVGAALQLLGARAVWDDWSKTSGKFDAADQDRVWASFHGERKEGVVTVASIYALAKERGWYPPDEPKRRRKKQPAVPSEDTLALDFAGRHGDELRFVSFWGKWLKWTAEKWQVEKTLAAFDHARKICRDHLIAASLRAKTVAAVELLARSDRRLAATTDQWDADPWLFNTPAGTVELITGKLREHRPQDYITKIAGCAPGREGCPMFFQFLNKIFNGDQDLIDYLQKFFGCILTGLTTEHAMLFFHGAGANGKSVLVSTIAGILGEYHRVAPIDTFTATGFSRHSTDLAGLMGARLVTAHETEEGAKWAEAKLKALTGGDKITAQFMRQDYFDYVPAFKLAITGNHKPGLQSVDEAMRRRLNLIPFNVTIPKADRDQSLAEKLKAEWPGILTWMIDGCLLWQEEGGLHPPKAVIAATDEYLESEDAMATWINECCELKESYYDTAAELFKSWKAWAELMRETVGSAKGFSNKLQARPGIKKIKIGDSKARGYSGIRVVKIEQAQPPQSSFYRAE